MNAPSEMDADEVARVRLQALRQEHRDLDEAISALSENPVSDGFTLRRLKKQKLLVKEEIEGIRESGRASA